ncbi:NPC intracellular cholesterol transporter 1-like [Penaeus indicus]|uniref:NPC intracellular cholesterol transporter 1-like n=1 Tax=Penaeus indicus TaxID=29960 RepID=UPI00300CD259
MATPTVRKGLVGVFTVFLAFLLGAKAEIHPEGHCIWYGLGDKNPEKYDSYLNSAYDGPAKKLTDAMAVDLLSKHCPEMVEEIRLPDGTIETCCDPENIMSLVGTLSPLESFLTTCPACSSNLRKNFCYSACHPKQSSFLRPTRLCETESHTSIFSIDFLVHESYTHSAFASCENVVSPALNSPALDVLCGDAGKNCTPEKLFSYFGNNEFAPFNITYVWASEDLEDEPNIWGNATLTMHPFDVPTTPCNTSDPAMHCQCTDCLPSCPSVPELPPPTQQKEPPVVSVDALTLSLALAYAMVAAAVVSASCFWSKVDQRGEEHPDNTGDAGWQEVLTAGVAKASRSALSHLGRFVARHPLPFLALGLAPAAYLASQGFYPELTTDPLAVFASSASKSMQDKLYFDSHLGPAHRAAQLILTPKNYDGFNVTLGHGESYRFGPALNTSFLLEAMALQGELEKLTGTFEGQSVGLKDVCVKPLAPQADDCFIHSALNYWQNDPERLQENIAQGIEQFAQHLVLCVKQPNQVSPESCLGSFGGPVPPYTSLGGFLEEGEVSLEEASYTEATALILTFFLEAAGNESALGPVLEWEKLTGTFEGQSVGLKDVCVKPLAPQADDCFIHSALNYWQNDPERLQENIAQGIEQFAQHLVLCVKQPNQVSPESCLGSFGGPVPPYTSLGGFLEEGEVSLEEASYTEATALILTFFLEAAGNESALGPVLEWEKAFLTFLQERAGDEALSRGMDIAFSAERGAEDEHVREGVADLPVFLGVCLAMSAYAALALGRVSAQCKRVFIDSKLGLALGGVVVILASAVTSVACVSYLGFAPTVFVVQRKDPECHPDADRGRAFPNRCSRS